MKKFLPWISLAIIFVVGIWLRFSSALFQRDYWYDEAFTGVLLKEPWHVMNQMIYADVHPPLYYWLAKLWAMPFGYSPWGIRSFSVLMGLASIVSIFWIGKKMFSARAGMLAAVITAISPFAIEYSQEARMYALFGFLMLWTVWFFYRALETDEKKYWILWGIIGGLSFYTHYLSLFFFVVFYVSWIVYRMQNAKANPSAGGRNDNARLAEALPKRAKFKVKNAFSILFGGWGFWTGVGVIVLFFACWFKIFINHISRRDLGWIPSSNLSEIPSTLQIFFFGHPAGTGGTPVANEFRYFFDGASVGLIILGAIIVLLTIAWMKNIKKKECTLLSVLSFGTLVFLIVLSKDLYQNGDKIISIKLYVARYFMPAAVIIYLLFAGLVTEVISWKWNAVVVMAFYVLLLLNLEPLKFNSSWNSLYEVQSSAFPAGSTIVASGPFDYTSARFYFGKERARFYNKNNPTESFNWVLVKDESKVSLDEIGSNPNYVVVDSDCNWQGIDLEEVMKVEGLSVCKVN